MDVEDLPEGSWARDAGVRRIMLGNRPHDTLPETRVRSLLHAAGFRFRKHTRPLPGLRCEADVVFPTERVAVFIDGCYWHGCPVHWRRPATNGWYWEEKIMRNSDRDTRNDAALLDAGWAVVRVWEHEPPAGVAARVGAVVRARQRGKSDRFPQ